ncbi:sensor histidine kinase [uncultured Acetatifactor sp.]|jgi:two-component system sensor histidine kinase AgrC|uniref:sensor histidine kinase n=1 Tax=uncultured Acetatifactor sp. TaxID=1671927 RepID=UPI002608D9E2|nr:GHKL domain-containing protein [uncultured Acetatifactor sp.]MCI8695411.1 GHKL domain-containing protein [Lachnospiraceae bacterium]
MDQYIILLLIAAVPGALVGTRLYVRHLAERQIARYQDDLTRRHCEEVDNLYRQTRGWRHDFKNHLQTMQAYLEMGQTKQLGSYLRELTDDYNSVDIQIRTGNAMVDAILNSKLSVVKARDIRVDATAALPPDLPVSEVDLSVMIGNLLDNAMEACLKVPQEERFLRFYMAKVRDNLYIYVMNAADGAYRKGFGKYLSTKGTDSHGYGLYRIDKVVKKYRGYLNRQDEGNVFATEILLPL